MKSAHSHESKSQRGHYGALAWMAGLSFLAMYALMYAMVDRFDDVYVNLNQFYMAGLMAMPMVLIELVLMRSMYADTRLNVVIAAACVVAAAVSWFGIREQWAISERQFLKSMIPHHGAAVLMCEQTGVTDAAVLDLCRRILANQKAEIEEMEALLGS